MNFNTTKEKLLNDFCDNASQLITNIANMYAKQRSSACFTVDDSMLKLRREFEKTMLCLDGLTYIKRQGESSEFYNEIEEILRYNGGEIFEMSQNDVLNLCYRAGFYF
jgi:hypothetical protein